MRGGKIKTTRC